MKKTYVKHSDFDIFNGKISGGNEPHWLHLIKIIVLVIPVTVMGIGLIVRPDFFSVLKRWKDQLKKE